MIEAAPSVNFFILTLDILILLQSTVRSMQIRMLQLSREEYFVFQ